ncbi:MAG: multiheme c-type cytochrome [Nannocystaceae bacterium]
MVPARTIGLFAVALFASGLVVWVYPAQSPGPLLITLLHALVGLVAVVAVAVYVPRHLRATAKTRRASAIRTGWALVALVALIFGTGLIALAPERALIELLGDGGPTWTRGLHLGLAALALGLLWIHRWFAPRDVMSDFELAISLGLLGLVVAAAAPGKPPAAPEEGEQYDPESALRRDEDGALAVEVLADVDGCRVCHASIVEQWEGSAHRLASFRNPFYLHALRLLERERGREATKFCAACHDPLPLIAGVFDDPAPLAEDARYADRGVTCLVCHTAIHSGEGEGNGELTLARPRGLWPLERDPTPRGWLSRTLVRANPAAHRDQLAPDLLRTPNLCAPCHEVNLPDNVTGFRFTPGFDDADDWQRSPFSHEVALPLGQAERKSCRACHMPRVASDDLAARDGKVVDHRFAAANLSLAAHAGDAAWQARTVEALEGAGIAAVPIALTAGELLATPLDGVVAPVGEPWVIHVLVRAADVGHAFPGGTADSHEAWVELELRDADGRRIAGHGAPIADGGPPDDAHVLRARLIDARGEAIRERDAFRSRTVLYRHLAPAGAGEVVRFAVTLPPGVSGPITVTARVWFRKFARELVSAVYDARGEPAPAQPRLALGERSVELALGPRGAAGPCPEGDFSDVLLFISGATLQGEYALALAVAERARGCGAGDAARIKRARTLLAASRAGEALAEIEAVMATDPAPGPGPRMVAAQAEAALGRDEQALARIRELTQEFPGDRLAHRLHARLSLRTGEDTEAHAAAAAAVRLEPTDTEAWYLIMLAAAALGEEDDEVEAREVYEYLREDETQRALARRRRAADPHDDLEAQPRHIHQLTLDGGAR